MSALPEPRVVAPPAPFDEPEYTSYELIDMTGITYRQLDYWIACGWLPATAHGSGRVRRHSRATVLTCLFAKDLQAVGFTAEASLRIASRLLARRPEQQSDALTTELSIGVRPIFDYTAGQ